MPRRDDIKKIFIIGSGPIVIGQACEFDYSGTQACKALREEGYEIVLLNSNPATIMTDPDTAERTYIEPITVEVVEKIIAREKPDAILPTLGGQTALNVTVEAYEAGIFDKYGVEAIGAGIESIRKAEDRERFKEVCASVGIPSLKSMMITSRAEGMEKAREIGFPIVLRPSFTLGGTGGSVAYNVEEFEDLLKTGLDMSPVHSVLLEESVIGWKEFELEVMRDNRDNVVIVCSIENLDPMGVHTGDSITVAPAQTLTDREYQLMRDWTIRVMRAIGVDAGGCNVQFCVHPGTGRMVIIEMNPRVSRSSALASKATGFPIAKISAKLAVGFTLDEIRNDITRETPACFEPTIDYCVVKIPRFTFEKFKEADPMLTIQMKSVGEVMAIGRTFKESLQKGLRSLEIKRMGLGADGRDMPRPSMREIRDHLYTPNSERLFYVKEAFEADMDLEEIAHISKIDPWFLENIKEIVEETAFIRGHTLDGRRTLPIDDFRRAKQMGFSDVQLANLLGTAEDAIRARRDKEGVRPVFKLVDTCGGEFDAYTPYYYSTYDEEDETRHDDREAIMILGGGPNRIGQGIEFDYCCVHASMAARKKGSASIMVNCNPETVSTDYDTSDRLYFEPLTLEDVLEIVRREKPAGVIVQFGGQTPLNLAVALEKNGVPIIGTSPDAIDRAEDRERFAELCESVKILQTESGIAYSLEKAQEIARRIGYPLIVRPSFVLGGRGMEIVYDDEQLKQFATEALIVSDGQSLLVDKYLENAVELDVDAAADGIDVAIAGIMEHIEEAGVHSGDAAMVLPAHTLSDAMKAEVERVTREMALHLHVKGLMNIQFAVTGSGTSDERLYILEVNPRASRTVPFVSKVTGIQWAKVATRIMLGETLEEMGLAGWVSSPPHYGVKESTLPWNRFPGVDAVLGPEMRSTGEVMGIDATLDMAFAKSQLAVGMNLPKQGAAFISVKAEDKPGILPVVKKLESLGFKIIATTGTRDFLRDNGVEVERVNKVSQGRPHIVDEMKNGKVDLIINTPSGKNPHADEVSIRATAVNLAIPLITTVTAAEAVANAIALLREKPLEVRTLQEYTEAVNRDGARLKAD